MKHQFWSCHSLKRSVMGHAMPSDRTPAAAAKAAPRVFPIFSPLPEVPLTYPSFSLPLPSQHLSGVSFCALCGDREAPTRPRTFRATTCRPLCGKARPAPVQLRVPTGVFRIRRGVGRRTVHAEVSVTCVKQLDKNKRQQRAFRSRRLMPRAMHQVVSGLGRVKPAASSFHRV